jgi:hypothetical protein
MDREESHTGRSGTDTGSVHPRYIDLHSMPSS